MRIRGALGAATAALVLLTMTGCDGAVVEPSEGSIHPELSAKRDANPGGGGGNGGADKEKGDLYSDLMIILRDVDGVPIVYPEMFVDERGNETYCVQPVSHDLSIPHPDAIMGVDGAPATITPQEHAVDGRTVSLVPIYAQFQQYLPEEEEEETDPHGAVTIQSDDELVIAPGPCDIIVLQEPVYDGSGVIIALDTIYDYTGFADEVELERLNMARAPESVLRKQMQEVEALFAATDPALVTLDPAGRPVFDGTMVDAMPKLQGIHEALLETGTIPGATGGYPHPFRLMSQGFTQWTMWDISSLALGGSASKFGRLSIDAISYHDRVMAIPVDATWGWSGFFPNYSSELDEYFVNYSGFSYDRATTYPGCITYIDEPTGSWNYVGKVLEMVEFTDLGDGEAATSNIAGYAQMAEDARAVIYWIHAHDALIKVADPVGINTCEAQGYVEPAPEP